MDRRSIFVCAGEVSGDHYAAQIAHRLRELGYDGTISGLCGDESERAGVERIFDASALQIIGITEVLSSLGEILKILRGMSDEIVRRSPAVLILIDSPDFNLRLARRVRKKGYAGKIFYISPPSVWAWRSGRVRAIRRDVDISFPLFKFEHDYLVGAGCASEWIGHPLVDESARWIVPREEVLSSIRGDVGDRRVIAMLPGSRGSEIKRLFPVLRGVAERLDKKLFAPVFSIAPGLKREASSTLNRELDDRGLFYTELPGTSLISIADAVCGSSGTATAQALLLKKFFVVLYKVSAFSALVGRFVLHNRFFAIPNLLAGEEFFPELIQGRATPELAHKELARYLALDGRAKREVDARMDGLVGSMGRPGAVAFWADRIYEEVLAR